MEDKVETFKPGYHLAPITKGVIGEVSKIEEELAELKDAIKQKSKVMALVELSDLLGAIDLYLRKHHPDTSIEDLLIMSAITARAFKNGARS
jgi:hypothetical protein